ncbi:MAG TPA: ATP-dependent DNA ligase [Acidimicrobiales bacterium]|nr:ATP-dependent DNA ligase [Acidimicrobiales bacterium]
MNHYTGGMDLPVNPPVSPMLAKLARDLPTGDGYVYEPKWDGFRGIVFRDGDEVEIGSRNTKPLTRYFPELIGPLREHLPERCVVDGELVIGSASGLDFDALLQRIHPAASRVARLAKETPASFMAFDLLALGDDDLRQRPFAERRELLESALRGAAAPIHLTPATDDPGLAAVWFDRFEGAGLDGVMAKAGNLTYDEGKRTMLKVKHDRTADVVVAGFRWHKDGKGVGSLLLGLYDGDGTLHHVGVATSFSAARRKELVDEVADLRGAALDDHPWRSWAEGDQTSRMPGAGSRWNAGKELGWEPLRIERVAEVAYDHLQGDRFRHATRLVRWRSDRQPRSCTYDQLDTPAPEALAEVFGG